MTKVVVAVGKDSTNQRWVDVFKTLKPDWQVYGLEDSDSQPPADFAVVWRPAAQLFSRQTQLKAIFNIGAGVDGIDFTQVPEQVPVYRVEDAGMAVQMAEYAVHGVALATQRFSPYVAQQQQKAWQQLEPVYKNDWPIGVMGYGKIGAKVAEVLQLLGYPVSVWVRSERPAPQGLSLYAGTEQLPDFLSNSRILINVLPLTPETQGVVNQTHLQLLQPGGFFINMARGPHVIDEELIAQIDAGHLTGALLDVFHIEPLPEDHRFWIHPKIHVTPHISGVSLREPTAAQITEKITQFLQQLEPTGLVQRARHY